MAGFWKKAVLGTALAASTLVTVAPAQAQYGRGYGGYRHRDGIGAGGAAVLGGIVGLGLGAAIAGNNNRGRYYDRGYYYDQPRVVVRERYYEQPRVIYRDRYYDRRGYDRGYYDRGYYGGGYGGGYYDRGYYGY